MLIFYDETGNSDKLVLSQILGMVYDLRQISKEESHSKFKEFMNFCDITNLHLEPALKGKYSTVYHASNVIHTRIIDVNDRGLHSIDPYDIENIKQYYKILNHDGYKQPFRLIKAEQYNMKLMSFVQAMVPSNIVLTRKGKLFYKRSLLFNSLLNETDPKKSYELEVMLNELWQEEAVTTNNFTTEDFLHYRFWFFDLDFEYHVPFEKILEMLAEIGLYDFVNVIVQTSPTKYHIYIKSEMVASKKHVDKWPDALGEYDFGNVSSPRYIEKMLKKYPKKNGLNWWRIARRGLPSVYRLDSIPVPIPEEATLVYDKYYGDDKVYESYLNSYKEIATVLGADLSVSNETRNAQLVGYTNPKNGYVANVVYACKDAPVLTTKMARTVIHEKIQDYYAKYKFPFYQPTCVKKEMYEKNIISDLAILKDTYQINNTSKRMRQKFSGIPESPEMYCTIHKLQNEVLWDRDITGHSNAMLLLFTRFAHLHIDLSNQVQQRTYFDTVIKPYLKNRISKDLRVDVTLDGFFSRFKIACKHNSKTLPSNRNNINAQTKYSSSEDIQEKWNTILLNAFGEDHFTLNSKAHIRIRKIICDHVINYASLVEGDNSECFQYQIPSLLLNGIHGYKDKLKFYESLGLYSIGRSYVVPLSLSGNILRSGQCKQHTLVLKEIDKDIVARMKAKTKKKIEVEEEKALVAQDESKVNDPENSLACIKLIQDFNNTQQSDPVDANKLEITPSSVQNLALDYVLSIVNSKESLMKTPAVPFVFKEKEVVPVEGYKHQTISDLMQLVVHKDSPYYSQLEENFKKIKDTFLCEKQQEADHKLDDYQLKRAKIFNNVRPLTAKELRSISEKDRMLYLMTVSDLVDVSKYCRETIRDRENLATNFKLSYALNEIEKQVINKTSFKFFDVDQIKLMRWIQRDLQAHIWQCNFICSLKQKLHIKFLSTLDEEIEPIFRHVGSLFRDYNRKMSQSGVSHGGYLNASQAAEYDIPVLLSKEESVYYKPVEHLVDQLKIMFYRLPYDDVEKKFISDLLISRSSVIEKPLNNLRTLA